YSMNLRIHTYTLFPYTTLFRSDRDLDNNWAVVAEGIQTILRREGYPKPYEALKELTRTNNHITKDSIAEFIDTLEVSDSIKNELDRKSTRLNSSHVKISYAVLC